MSGTSAGTLFGYGTYLTPNFSKADHYTDTDRRNGVRLGKTAKRTVIITRAALGAPHVMSEGDTMMRIPPPYTADGYPYDSVFAMGSVDFDIIGAVDYSEIVIGEKYQLLPSFLVEYRHLDGCL